jgi:hypothetical protein
VNFHKAPQDIPLGDIKEVTTYNNRVYWRTVKNGLQLETAEGVDYRFVVDDRDYLVRLLQDAAETVDKGESK